jgi:tellurite resistance protein TehA-like permease
MKKIYILLIWLMVLVCGGCAFTEVLAGAGSVAGFLLILTGLAIIIYITRLHEEIKRDN